MTTTDTLFYSTRVANAINFINLPNNGNFLYMFLGEATPPDSNSPVPATNVEYEKYTRAGIFFLQQIAATNLTLVIPKINWTLNTIYTQYSKSDPNLFSKNFYVLADNNVYKCLNNNSGAMSTVPPTGTSVFPITLSDGYQWKFMYNISDILQTNFSIDQWMPVPTGTQKTPQQIAVEQSAVEDSESPPLGHGANASLELGASSVMLSQTISFNIVSSNPVTQGQFGLLLNPFFNGGVPLTGSNYVIGNNSNINLSSGMMLQVEQHDQITSSSTDNSEILQVILSF